MTSNIARTRPRVSSLSTLAALFALFAPLSSARAEPPATAPAIATRAPGDPLLLAPAATTTAARASSASRIGGEIVGGALGLGASFLVGFGSAHAIASDCKGDFCGLGAAAMGGFIGVGTMTLAVPLGVTVAGNTNDGHGSYLASLGGSALGAGAGLGLIYAVEQTANHPDWLTWTAVATGLALNVGGAILGYELSNHF